MEQHTTKIEQAKQISLEYHGDQQYGNRPYQFHLEDVISVLIEQGINDVDLHIIAWLHDVLEDTNIDSGIISDQFGEHVLLAVQALSDGEGENRKEKKAVMMKNLIKNQSAMIVKLADRISNVRVSIQDGNERKLQMYKSEQENFAQKLDDAIETKEGKSLLQHLNSLLK